MTRTAGLVVMPDRPFSFLEAPLEYPQVMDEIVTIDKLVSGKYRGMARYGDGDFNVLRGQKDRYHKACPQLAAALAQTLHRGSNQVLNCLIPPPPDMRDGNLAYQRWVVYLEVNAGIFPFLNDEMYGSSNISRMDSCPHLHTTSWWNHVAQLWRDKDICLVSGSERSLTSGKLWDSPSPPKKIKEIKCRPQDNFAQIDSIYQQVIEANVETVLLCCGLTARPLVHKLVTAGHKVYDLGHFGMWFRGGFPIPLTECPR